MTQPNDFERRLASIESEMRTLRRDFAQETAIRHGVSADVASARHLAQGADRDVSLLTEQMRAHTGALNALRETQVEHYADHKAEFAEVKAGIAHIVTLLERLTDDPSRPV